MAGRNRSDKGSKHPKCKYCNHSLIRWHWELGCTHCHRIGRKTKCYY
jgi:hypothetical protein